MAALRRGIFPSISAELKRMPVVEPFDIAPLRVAVKPSVGRSGLTNEIQKRSFAVAPFHHVLEG
jgi:GTP1/Obg family GTP-binding protein